MNARKFEPARRCYVCGRARWDWTLTERRARIVELRPYGPDGADVCLECAFGADANRPPEVQS